MTSFLDYDGGHFGSCAPETLFHHPFGIIFSSFSSVLWLETEPRMKRKTLRRKEQGEIVFQAGGKAQWQECTTRF
jgi:hypothetical protein